MKKSSLRFRRLLSTYPFSLFRDGENSTEDNIDEDDIPVCMYGPPPAEFEYKDIVDED